MPLSLNQPGNSTRDDPCALCPTEACLLALSRPERYPGIPINDCPLRTSRPKALECGSLLPLSRSQPAGPAPIKHTTPSRSLSAPPESCLHITPPPPPPPPPPTPPPPPNRPLRSSPLKSQISNLKSPRPPRRSKHALPPTHQPHFRSDGNSSS
jgi:hypothetical protein